MPRAKKVLVVLGVAVLLAEVEALQDWVEHRQWPMHDRLAWRMWALLPPWLLMAALVPAIAWLVRRFPLTRRASIAPHALASLLFPVVHLGSLALAHSIAGDPTALWPRITGLLAFHYVFDVLAYWAIVGGLLLASRAPTPHIARREDTLTIREGTGVRLMPTSSITWIEARNYCARIHTTNGRHLVRESLGSLARRLDPAQFERVHRSAIVNRAHVVAVRSENGRPVIELEGGAVVPVAKARWRGLVAQWPGGPATRVLAVLGICWATSPLGHWATMSAQASRNWRPEDRALLTDLSYVTAVGATRRYVYAATPNGLAVYDRAFGNWTETIGSLDGFPPGIVTAMAADPNDDRAWLAFNSRWAVWDPFGRRLESGPLPGSVDQVVLDASDPGRGAWYHTLAGWYLVERGSFAAMPAPAPPASRLGGLSARELLARIPSFDAIRLRIERDEQLRTYRLTSAASAPITNDLYVGTDGNGTFRIDPLTYQADRLPAGLAGSATGAIASWRGTVCAAGEARVTSPHHGITCFDESLGNFDYVERMGLATLPVGTVRRLLVTERAIWAATDQGLIRAPRRGGRPVQLLARDGLPSDQCLALAPSADGVFVGTAAGIASVSDTGRTPIVSSSARGPAVLSIAIPGNDTIWAGTSSGLVGFLLPLGGPVALPIGPGPLREPIVAVAVVADTIIAATQQRFVIRAGNNWQVMDPPGRPVGRIASIVPGETGFWVAGDQGFAYFDPQRPLWNALAASEDVPLPVRDVAETHGYVWVATEAGVVRYAKRLVTQ